eukprot:7977718-Alexandrium_andersonii.AAC.1
MWYGEQGIPRSVGDRLTSDGDSERQSHPPASSAVRLRSPASMKRGASSPLPKATRVARPVRAHGSVASQLSSAPLRPPLAAGCPWPVVAPDEAMPLASSSASSTDLAVLGEPPVAPAERSFTCPL